MHSPPGGCPRIVVDRPLGRDPVPAVSPVTRSAGKDAALPALLPTFSLCYASQRGGGLLPLFSLPSQTCGATSGSYHASLLTPSLPHPLTPSAAPARHTR